MPEKTIPQNIDAEQSVLGSMFLTKKALQKAHWLFPWGLQRLFAYYYLHLARF